jgi:hypothetical protein
MAVAITAYDPEMKTFNEQLPAAVATLNGLESLSLIRSDAVPVFPSSLLDSLPPLTQLTSLIINKVMAPTLSSTTSTSSSPLSNLPASLQEMQLYVDVDALGGEGSTRPQHGGRDTLIDRSNTSGRDTLCAWDFRNLAGLQFLHLNAAMDPTKEASRFVPVHLPTSITSLWLSGSVDVVCGEGVEFPHVLEFEARGDKTPADCIEKLMSRMPNVMPVTQYNYEGSTNGCYFHAAPSWAQ